MFCQRKATRWTKKQIKKNLQATPIDCGQLIHPEDRNALAALQAIPLLDKITSKLISLINDKQREIINLSSYIHITEKQLPKIYMMVKSICHRINIEMPEIYLKLDRGPNACTYGTEKHTIIIHSGLLECLEDDEVYSVLAHECGHIACKHSLYHTLAVLLLDGGMVGLDELATAFAPKGIVGSIVGGVVSIADSALQLALYHWHRCSEFSADRVATICCGEAKPVIESMMRLAGGTTHISSEVDTEAFIAQAEQYKAMVGENKINKTLEFLLTKNDTHPRLSVRAFEIKAFAETSEFAAIPR